LLVSPQGTSGRTDILRALAPQPFSGSVQHTRRRRASLVPLVNDVNDESLATYTVP